MGLRVHNHTGWQGSKYEWIPSKSNSENDIHVYFTILRNKQITINRQMDSQNCLDIEKMF